MDEKFVMGVIKNRLNSKNGIDISYYDTMIKYFDDNEKDEFNEILKKNNIKITNREETTENLIDTGKPLPGLKKITISNEQLCSLYQKGEKQALDFLWIKNEALVKSIVNRYSNKYKTILDSEDLEQSCFISFKRAVEKFDSTKEVKFSTYVVWWLKQIIFRTLSDTGTLIRIPVHRWEEIIKVKMYINKYSSYSLKEIINIINQNEGYDETKIEYLITLSKNILNPDSLDILIGEDEGSNYYEILVDSSQVTVEERIIERNMKEQVNICLDCLTEKERDVIKKRFGFFNDKIYTLEEIGREYGVTREWIRQIEEKAIKKLRKKGYAKRLNSFLEG